MGGILSGIISLIIPVIMIFGSSAGPALDNTADSFMKALETGNHSVMSKYVDNDYVNLLENAGDKTTSDALYEDIFANLDYEIIESAAKGDVAVVKMNITNSDFSKVDEAYDEASYKYVTGNLYEDEVTDKNKLADKCLEIYLEEISKASEKNKTSESTIYLPLIKNDHNGWDVLVTDDNMRVLCGNLVLPESEK